MHQTKKQILEVALKLFNKKGFSTVSLRNIADEMNISLGNLTYHFKKREDIVFGLYQEFIESTEQNFIEVRKDNVELNLVIDIIDSMLHVRVKYQFIMKELNLLLAENANIKKHYVTTLEKRKVQFIALFDSLAKKEILKKEAFPGEHENFYERIQILGTFWIANASIIDPQLKKATVDKNRAVIIQSIYPYLTNKGLNQFKKLA